MNYTTLTTVFLAVFLLNRYVFEQPLLGALLLVLFFAGYGRRLGQRLLPHFEPLFQTGAGALVLYGGILILGTFIYYVGFLPSDLWTIFVMLTPVAVWLLTPRHKSWWHFRMWKTGTHRLDRSDLLLTTLILLLFVGVFSLLNQVEIYDAVRSTWERVPNVVLWLSGLLFVALGALMMKGRERSLTLPLVMAMTFLCVGVAVLVYPIGFGFDSFLHQATEQHIATFGTIDPKPFYYIGQYVSVLFASQAFTLPLLLVDRFLLPVLASLLIPFALLFASSFLATEKRGALFSVLGLFLLPLSSFIVTTPQGLANLLTLLLVLFSLPTLAKKEGLGIISLWIVGLAATAVHPLAGIPALLYLILMTLQTKTFGLSRHVSRIFFLLTAILGSIALPTIFVVNALISHLDLSFSFSALAPTRLIESLHIDLIFQSGFNTFLDFTYLLGATLLLLFVIITTYILLREKNLTSTMFLPALMAVILFVNYLVMKSAIDFTFLINYERSNYSDRLLTLIFFFLTPYVLLFFLRVWNVSVKRDVLSRAFVVLLFSGVLLSQLYLTYPRRDNYETSHGFNTGSADLLAVKYINENAPSDYIVLANQQVAAGAVLTYGFKQYYGNLFYYPIPTGGTLYQSFLAMNERPSREVMEQAMTLVNVNTAYYVVNDYWWQAKRLIETAKLEANDWIAIDDGRVYVFRYNYIDLQ